MNSTVAAASLPPRNDQILATTRVVAAVLVPVLLLAFIILYFFPAESGERFSWKIAPNIMSMFVGAGYFAGAYFFARLVFERRWHRVTTGFLAVTTFTWSMLVLTLLHLDYFDFSRFAAQLWLFLYVVTPILVPWLWWRNRQTDPHQPEADDVRVPGAIRLGTALTGGVFLMCTLLFYIMPDVAIAIWPWQLVPASARALGGWFALFGVGAFSVAAEPRWGGWRLELESMAIWQILILVAAAFNLSDFTTPLNWYLIATAAATVAFVAIYASMEAQRRQQRQRSYAT